MTATLWMLSRKHPPSIGGMQQLSFQLASHLRALRPVTLVAWGRGQWALPLFFLSAFFRILVGLLRGSISIMHIGDPALAALAWLPRRLGVPVVATVHGLDISYPNPVYQAYLALFFWRRMSAYVCISRHVADMVVARGIDASRVHIIPVGIIGPVGIPAESTFATSVRDAGPLLLTIGRLVERKGVAWFVDQVASQWLPKNPGAMLVVAGDGPMRSDVEAAITRHGLSGQVHLLGEIADAEKWWLLARADLVLMPNIPVADDVEGFGLVALEAAVAGTYVLAADMEGLRDAVTDGANGARVEPGNAGRWIAALDQLAGDRKHLQALGATAREFVLAHFSWPAIAAQHQQLFEALESRAP